VRIPAGTFIMGALASEEEREGVPEKVRGQSLPRRSVKIAEAFWLGKYPVTRGEFSVFAAATGRPTPDEAWSFEPNGNGKWTYKRRKGPNWRNPGFDQTGDHPVVCVSHEDAMDYIKWLTNLTGQSYRLPSEAEWEYAARAGTSTARFWGDGRDNATRYANVADRALLRVNPQFDDSNQFFDGDDRYAFTAPVGSFLPNPYGLYDMLGNVWEVMADKWNGNLNNTSTNGTPSITGDSRRRVVRGGSWYDFPSGVRAGCRGWDFTSLRSTYTGFRVART
jgi:formylglycine-generating enzyme